MSRFDDKVDKIEAAYNPENDVIKGAPRVTWADYELLKLIVSLQVEIDALRERVRDLERALYDTVLPQ